MTLRSPLDTLKQLRQRAHDAEQLRLAARAEAERRARAERESAGQRLSTAVARHEAARLAEDERLARGGITAAEGQRRSQWESAQRSARALLWEAHQRALDGQRSAAAERERARLALTRADGELRQVRQHLERRDRMRLRLEEQQQQESADEASLRRFMDRHQA